MSERIGPNDGKRADNVIELPAISITSTVAGYNEVHETVLIEDKLKGGLTESILDQDVNIYNHI